MIFELNGADHSRTDLVDTGPPPDKHLDHRRSITAVSLLRRRHSHRLALFLYFFLTLISLEALGKILQLL